MSTINYPKLTKSEIQSIFNMIDANNDGITSTEEIEKIVNENRIKR